MPEDRLTDWLAGGGEMGERIRSFDWSRTPIGPIEGWPPALRMMVRFLLANRFPWLLWWGPQYVSIYNDAYRPILGTKHPWALGQPLSECWKEIWHILQPLVDAPFTGGPATWDDDILLEIDRHGFTEETHFTIAYSPVPDETTPTGIGGVLATVHEITDKIVGERRLTALSNLAAATSEAETAEDACLSAALALAEHPRDVPFALLYLNTSDGKKARLASHAGTDTNERFSPGVVEIDATEAEAQVWPLAGSSINVIEDLIDRFGANIPRGPWSDPPKQAMILPIRTGVAQPIAGSLVVGVSARLKLDEAYRGFYELLASQIGIAIGKARAYEEERKRAEALAELDRAKTVFFSNVSHEFRTPLTLMLGPLADTLTKSDALSAADRERVEAAHRNSLRLMKLVNKLLDFSRIEAGRIESSYEATDLGILTGELASVFRSTIESAGLELSVDCPPLAQPVYVDREMWEKIILNLISNAFKFTLAGRIDVSLRQVGSHAELTIADTGSGIPEEEIPHLFERFHRFRGSRGRSYEGSGIGLALVQELIKLHGGTIRVESKIDQGSRFVVSIPLGMEHLPKDRVATAPAASPVAFRAEATVTEMSQWLRRPAKTANPELFQDTPVGGATTEMAEHVLLADDNADMRQYVERLLKQSGYTVTVVADGNTALQAAHDRKPDLVVSDVMMPGLDGFGLLREFRSNPDLATVPVILLSARAGEEARIEGMESGATDYLIKPFSAGELVARVRATLELSRVRNEASSAIRKSEERFRALVTATSYAIYRMSSDWTKMIELEGKGFIADSVSPSTSWLDTYIHPDDRAIVVAEINKAIAAKGMFELEHRVRRIDGSMGWTLSRAVPFLDTDGGILEWFGTATDITERVKAEETRRLLIGELNHRVKNTLASVQAVAAQTLRHTKDPTKFAESFSGRIQALSRVHSLLTDTTWQGADMHQLIRDQLMHGPVDKTKIAVSGPAIQLDSQTAVLLALMLHELGTNSAKYGALSSGHGHVSIIWSAIDDILRLQWVERGGPKVARPKSRGFGTVLIEQSVKSAGGRAELLCEEEGITWNLSIKLPDIESQMPALAATPNRADLGTMGSTNAANRGSKRFSGFRFLVIEDEPLIGLELVEDLETAGAVADSVGNYDEALDAIARDTFDCVLLDANLHGRSVNEIAAALTRRRIPFIFITGYGRDSLPISFTQAPALAKPVSGMQLLDAVATLLPNSKVTGLRRRPN